MKKKHSQKTWGCLQSSILNPLSWIRNLSQSLVFNPQFSVLRPQSSVLGRPQSWVPNPAFLWWNAKNSLFCLKNWFMAFLSQMLRKAEHTHLEGKSLDQISLWGLPPSCASLPSVWPPHALLLLSSFNMQQENSFNLPIIPDHPPNLKGCPKPLCGCVLCVCRVSAK